MYGISSLIVLGLRADGRSAEYVKTNISREKRNDLSEVKKRLFGFRTMVSEMRWTEPAPTGDAGRRAKGHKVAGKAKPCMKQGCKVATSGLQSPFRRGREYPDFNSEYRAIKYRLQHEYWSVNTKKITFWWFEVRLKLLFQCYAYQYRKVFFECIGAFRW